MGTCEKLLDQASDEGGVLLLRGAPGIGKTSLLEAASARAHGRDFRVLSTAGSEAEMSFAFAALQPLLFPVIQVDTDMPKHLRTALLAALGLLDVEIPALDTVGLAVLGLLAGVATETSPLCLIIDDVHWLDASSAEVLRFVSRRLSADPIALFAAARDGGWPPTGMFPELRIEPLDSAAAEALLAARAPKLPSAARRRVLAKAEGIPLGLVELAGALSATRRDPAHPLPDLLPLTARLEAAFTERTVSLPEATRAVLLAAALAPTASLAEVLGAATALVEGPVEISALDAAERERLIELEGRQIRFRHPLVRSGVVQAATASRRRAAQQWPAVLQSAVAYAQAVTASEAHAGQCFEAALAGPAGSRAFDRGRVQLAFGRWLRRHQRRLEAREHLRAARDTFDQLGNEPFAQRARDELRATGEASPRRPNADWDQLSPQEVQIARLVADGLSNKEIGERMFLSHRTIASHLYRMFPKLGITTRAQLGAAIRSP
jgi:DNA-binding CsgD family transcriptional regulator